MVIYLRISYVFYVHWFNIIHPDLFFIFLSIICQEEPYYDYSIICEAMLTNYYNKSKKISIQKSKLLITVCTEQSLHIPSSNWLTQTPRQRKKHFYFRTVSPSSFTYTHLLYSS